MVVDCFPFFNELEILEIRLHELDPVVDRFVLVEGTRTHQKAPKPLTFTENKDRFKAFLPKITHLVIDQWPGFFHKFRVPRPFDYDNFQKEYVMHGLSDLPADATIIFSDLDEIPKAAKVRELKDRMEVVVFEQRLYNFWLNNLCTFYDTGGRELNAQKNKHGIGFWRGSVMAPKSKITTIKKMRLWRDLPDDQVLVAEEGGWHFSYIGDLARIKKKLEAYAHPEYNLSEEELIKAMESGTNVIPTEKTRFELQPLDSTFPLHLLKNQEKFSHLIRQPQP